MRSLFNAIIKSLAWTQDGDGPIVIDKLEILTVENETYRLIGLPDGGITLKPVP